MAPPLEASCASPRRRRRDEARSRDRQEARRADGAVTVQRSMKTRAEADALQGKMVTFCVERLRIELRVRAARSRRPSGRGAAASENMSC